MTDLEALTDREATRYVGRVLDAVQRAEDEGFVEFATDAQLMAHAPTAYWGSFHSIGPRVPGVPGVSILFRQDRNPHLASLGVERAYHAGQSHSESWDFLRHTFVVDGIQLMVFDGVNEALVVIRGIAEQLISVSPSARIDIVARTAAILFNPPWSVATWMPRSAAPTELADMALSTARGESVIHPSDTRMDAGVWRGDLFFLYHKVHNRQRLPRMRDPQNWSRSKGSP